jgi:hypothetical protein
VLRRCSWLGAMRRMCGAGLAPAVPPAMVAAAAAAAAVPILLLLAV